MGAREVRCSACGATNGADFPTCVRCASPLTGAPAAPPRPIRTAEPGAPLATYGLAGLCALVFLLQLSMALQRGGDVPILGGGHPADLLRVGALPGSLRVATAEPFRLLSAVFVHFGLLHIGMNMWAFVGNGRLAEAVIGTSRLVIAFTVSGALSFVTSVVSSEVLGGPVGLTAGASGAVLATMGLVAGVLARRKDRRWRRVLGEVLVYTLLFGFAVNASSSGVMINNAAHVGGLAAGFLFGLFWGQPRLPPEGVAHKALAALLVIAVFASLLLARLSPLAAALER